MTPTVNEKKAFYPEYGDNRIDYNEIKTDNLKVRADLAVCCFIPKNNFKKCKDQWGHDVFRIKKDVDTLAQRREKIHAAEQATFGSDQKYGNQKCAAIGTGFLIAKTKIMTAKHVVDAIDDLSKYYIVFHFTMVNSNHTREIFKSYVCKIKRVLDSSLGADKSVDWAICELNKHPEFGRPLTLNLDYQIKNNDIFSMWGHPNGLPMKFVPEGRVMPNEDVKNRVLSQSEIHHTFQLKIAAFSGNSGSPIFNNDGKVVGILIEGQTDYKVYTIREKICCFELPAKNIIKAYCVMGSDNGYEVCQRISSIKKFIEPFLKD